ncbi:DUF559 domain-containing protein [Hamadaea sp. NPDC051192]|uniref:DUF559 domain-containing protein n=1 Tax=Hamadaea sp. NPDC051192 TaxID=3154940 RepID=UPI003428691D
MDRSLRAALDAGDGYTNRADHPEVPTWAWSNAVRRGQLVRIGPGFFATPDSVDHDLRLRVALAYCRGAGAISHLSALAVHGVRAQPEAEPIHLTVPASIRLRSADGMVVHHRDVPESSLLRRRGFEVTTPAAALVDSWPLLEPAERIGLIIQATADRLVLAEHVLGELPRRPHPPGLAELRTLAGRLMNGCRSALELWGADHVFTGPDMPPFLRQAPIIMNGRTHYLDVFAEAEQVDFELDGAAWHGSPTQRERDLRRDSQLAAEGILVVRFSYARLMREPLRVRDEVRRILAKRRGR